MRFARSARSSPFCIANLANHRKPRRNFDGHPDDPLICLMVLPMLGEATQSSNLPPFTVRATANIRAE